VKFRYKKPDQMKSRRIMKTVDKKTAEKCSDNFSFSAAVAGFGMLLRNSEYTADMTWETVLKLARGSKGKDMNGYRSECIKLMEQAQLLDTRMASKRD
jgi:Ca-activated chloride channel homolog